MMAVGTEGYIPSVPGTYFADGKNTDSVILTS